MFCSSQRDKRVIALTLLAGLAGAGAGAGPCGSVAACARNYSVVVDTCVSGAPNQTWYLDAATLQGPLVYVRSSLQHAGVDLCAGVAGASPDLPGSALAVVLVPCKSASGWVHDPASGHFTAGTSTPAAASCGRMDANVYQPSSARANVCCAVSGTGSNQVFKQVAAGAGAGAGGSYRTRCSGQVLCLTARISAPPPPPPPPLPPPPPPRTNNTLFGPNDADLDGVCVAGMRLATGDPSYAKGCPCWRIPSVVAAGEGVVLVFAEGRWFTGDGCEPVTHK